MSKRVIAGIVLAAGVLAFLAVGCGKSSKSSSGGGGGSGVKSLPTSSCSPLEYEGKGKPDFIIASDLPLQGAGRAQPIQMTQAIEFILEQHKFKAGKYKVAYQSCDDATAQEGGWNSAKCTANARQYANNDDVIGVIGTFNSGCAKLEIPTANRADLAMVSPANTYPGLTVGGPGTETGEPDNYYPTGDRNYARVVWTDAFQGAADAILAQQLGLKKVFVLNDKQTYGIGVAKLFQRAAQKQGIQIAGFQAWDKNATSYESIATRIKSTGADGVFIGGIICNNGGKLVKDIRAGAPGVKIMAPDGFTPFSAVYDGAGQASVGMYISHPGVPVEQLKGAGKKFAEQFGKKLGGEVDPYSAYAAQAAEVLIKAISDSDGKRKSVTENLFKYKVKDGILGDFEIDKNGDTTLGTVTISQMEPGGSTKVLKTITPPLDVVKG